MKIIWKFVSAFLCIAVGLFAYSKITYNEATILLASIAIAFLSFAVIILAWTIFEDCLFCVENE